MKVSEKQIQDSIIDWLNWNGWLALRLKNVPTPIHQEGKIAAFRKGDPSTDGIADILALKTGQCVWLEVKRPSGKQTPNQIEFEKKVKKAGGEYYVVRSIDEVQEICQQVR